MSVVETIHGLRKMGLADGAATPPPSPRNARRISVAAYVKICLGGLDGLLRAILAEYWRPDQILTVNVWEVLEDRNVPKELAELLTNGLEEAFCRGFLDDRRAVDMAVRRAELLIEENVTLPLMRDQDRVHWLMQNMEEAAWKGIVGAMCPRPNYE